VARAVNQNGVVELEMILEQYSRQCLMSLTDNHALHLIDCWTRHNA